MVTVIVTLWLSLFSLVEQDREVRQQSYKTREHVVGHCLPQSRSWVSISRGCL